MRQLWLNGTRMDSIPLLRQYFTHSEHHLRPTLCDQILEQCSSGALADWLSHQPELHGVLTQMEALGTITLAELRHCLLNGERPTPSQLAFLCNVPESWFSMALESHSSPDAIGEKRSRLMEYPWWDHMEPRLVTVSDWSHVITNREEFQAAMKKYRQRRDAQGHEPHGCSNSTETFYLCNTGTTYLWNLRTDDTGLRFVGCGNPTLWLDPRRFIPQINLNGQNLWLEGLTLRHIHTTKIVGSQDRIKQVSILHSSEREASYEY